MTFQDKDRSLQKMILHELFLRQTININKDVGVAHMQPEMLVGSLGKQVGDFNQFAVALSIVESAAASLDFIGFA